MKLSQFSLFSALALLGILLGQSSPSWADSEPVAQRSASFGCPSVSKKPAASGNLEQKCEPVIGRRSLTVVGSGQVTAPADVALLEFRFGSREPLSASDATAPGLSIQKARTITEAALQPTVKALMAAGVPSSNVTIQTSSLQNPTMLVRLDKPTQERLQQIVLTVDQSLKSSPAQPSPSLFLQSIGAGYAVNSCQAIERSARRLALRDAQDQLKTLAQDLGVPLGELLAVTVLPFEGSPNSIGCGSKVGVPNTPIPVTIDEATPPYNPSDQPEVQVRSQVSITHAIKL